MPTNSWTDAYTEGELREFFPNGEILDSYYLTPSRVLEGKEYVIARNLMVTAPDDDTAAVGMSGIYRIRSRDAARHLHIHPVHGPEICIYRNMEDFERHDLLTPNNMGSMEGSNELICYPRELVARRTWDLWVAYQQRIVADPTQALLNKIRYLHRKQEFYQFNKDILPSW